MADKQSRWKAVCFYRTEQSLRLAEVEYEFEEIEDLSELVERGPDWRTLDRIEIRLARHGDEKLTIEQAERM